MFKNIELIPIVPTLKWNSQIRFYQFESAHEQSGHYKKDNCKWKPYTIISWGSLLLLASKSDQEEQTQRHQQITQ